MIQSVSELYDTVNTGTISELYDTVRTLSLNSSSQKQRRLYRRFTVLLLRSLGNKPGFGRKANDLN